jgi:imidazole glycerol-phosphate synthase subunit HisH
MIAIIDYGVGNLRSVHNAVRFISPQTKSFISSDPDKIIKADRIIFPGQGAMPDCIRELDKRGLTDVLLEVAKQKPFLGICLGQDKYQEKVFVLLLRVTHLLNLFYQVRECNLA